MDFAMTRCNVRPSTADARKHWKGEGYDLAGRPRSWNRIGCREYEISGDTAAAVSQNEVNEG